MKRTRTRQIRDLARTLYDTALMKSNADIDALIAHVFSYMKKIGVAKDALLLQEAIERVHEERQGYMTATIVSKHPLQQKMLAPIKEYLEKTRKRKIELREVIDQHITAGFKIICGDKLLDATANTYVKQLSKQLQR